MWLADISYASGFFDQPKSFRYFVHNLTAHIKVLHQICRMKFVSIPFSQLIRQWYVGLPLDTGTLIGLSLKITRSIMGYAMSLQRHTQKLFTSLSCVLLSLVLSLVIAFQKQTDLPQKQTAKQSGFFLKISKEIGKAWCKSLSASLQTFSLTARAYLNTQKIRTVLQSTTEKEQIDFTSDLTFNDYITWFESVEVVFRKLECWNFLWHLLAV